MELFPSSFHSSSVAAPMHRASWSLLRRSNTGNNMISGIASPRGELVLRAGLPVTFHLNFNDLHSPESTSPMIGQTSAHGARATSTNPACGPAPNTTAPPAAQQGAEATHAAPIPRGADEILGARRAASASRQRILRQAELAMQQQAGVQRSEFQKILASAEFRSKLIGALMQVPHTQFDIAVHILLSEAAGLPLEKQRKVAAVLNDKFRERLGAVSRTALEILSFNTEVQERYLPSGEGLLPVQYGWAVSPVNKGIYDIQIAALNKSGRLDMPLMRMPRLEQFAAELVNQARELKEGAAAGYGITRMASFFHQIAILYKIEAGADGPLIKAICVDSEERGKEIALQLREYLSDSGIKADIAVINSGIQKSPAGCPMFSIGIVESMSEHRDLFSGFLNRMGAGAPLHESRTFSHADDNGAIAVYSGMDLLPAPFFKPAQSNTQIAQVSGRSGFDDRVVDAESNSHLPLQDYVRKNQVKVRTVRGDERKVNFTLERSHLDKTKIMLGYMADTLSNANPSEAFQRLAADTQAVRRSSLGDDNDLAADGAAKAAQFADEIREAVVWFDLSAVTDPGQRASLLSRLDSADTDAEMKLGYLHKNGFPVFSDWVARNGRTYLKDDRYFHIHPRAGDKAMKPSDYVGENSDAGGTFNFVALRKDGWRQDDPAYAGLSIREARPRLPAGA